MERAAYDRMRELQQDHWWFVARRRIIQTALEGLDLPKDARLLEVGCGPGGNIGVLKRFGQVEAIEPDPQSRACAAERWGVKVHDGLLPDSLPTQAGIYDLVAAFDVIEHVDDDVATVRALAGLLRPSGRLVATVPAHAWMWSAHDVRHHHKRRYASLPFRRLFEQAGLEVVKQSYFNTLLFPLIAGVRVLKAAFGLQGAEDDRMPAPVANRLLASVMASERHVLRRANLPFGVSILLIARKPLTSLTPAPTRPTDGRTPD